MIFRKFVVLFWAFLLATAAIAGEEYRTKIEIDDDQSGNTAEVTRSEDGFIDSSELSAGAAHERHAVHIIKKEVNVTD